jgi:hypothetical protein
VIDDLISLRLANDLAIVVRVSWLGGVVVLAFALIVYIIVLLVQRYIGGMGRKAIEIDQVELGIGNQKIKLKPNEVDRQVAYKIWVELSTRTIGLPISFEHDVLFEIYNSWYNFFSVTRDMIKDVPVSKLHRADTRKIINLSIDVLNEGIRPHLTEWHARFARWYEHVAATEDFAISPQEIQRKFPYYNDLKADMEKVNERLMRYRAMMKEVVLGR